MATDLVPAYRYHESMLQVLQSEYPGQWQLKSPIHCHGLDALTTVYPDARLIATHRDPVEVVASVCSLIRSLSGTFTDADHTAYIARHWPEMIGTLVDRSLDFRRRAGGDAFIDVAYRDLVADPIGVVRAIYADVGRSLSADAEARMRAHIADAGRKDRFGKHSYALEDFGLRREEVAERFSEYTARFIDERSERDGW
jgi:hypothetical protein